MSTAKQLLGFDDRLFRLIGIPALGLIIPIVFYDKVNPFISLEYWIGAFISTIYATIYWHECRFIVLQSRKRFSSVDEELNRLMWQFGWIVLVLVGTATILNPLACLAMNGNLAVMTDFLLKDYGVALMNAATVVSLYEAIYFFQKYKRSAIETEQLKKEMVQSQLETLKSQVNPHFLFNSLNTLVSVIPEDPDKAVDFVRKLSKVYRYILEIRDKELISVQDELDFLNAYLFLQKSRFGENLQVQVNIPEHLQQDQIVPLSLQMLMENAIKHNIVSTEKPLRVSIETEKDNFLVIKNNLQLKQQVMDSTGTGLENISNRYQFATNKKVERIVTTSHFIVALPLIKTKVASHAGIDS